MIDCIFNNRKLYVQRSVTFLRPQQSIALQRECPENETEKILVQLFEFFHNIQHIYLANKVYESKQQIKRRMNIRGQSSNSFDVFYLKYILSRNALEKKIIKMEYCKKRVGTKKKGMKITALNKSSTITSRILEPWKWEN